MRRKLASVFFIAVLLSLTESAYAGNGGGTLEQIWVDSGKISFRMSDNNPSCSGGSPSRFVTTDEIQMKFFWPRGLPAKPSAFRDREHARTTRRSCRILSRVAERTTAASR
ncbi:MAG: hypothetical protein AAFV32_06930 [Myxococcota bacterium]